MAGELNEKCAIAGAKGDMNVSPYVHKMLFLQQHRGTEASGIVAFTENDGLEFHRAPGLVKDVFDEDIIQTLEAGIAIGQNRYSTSGSKTGHPQPVKDGAVCAALSLNGNLPQTGLLEEYLDAGNVHTGPMNDLELSGHALARSLRTGKDLRGAIEEVYPMMQGAFSCIAMHQDTIAAFRDPHGVKPLSAANFDGGIAFASEDSALEAVDPNEVYDVGHGELIIDGPDGLDVIQLADKDPKLDIFEFVYFALPGSRLYGQLVGRVRRNFGRELAQQHKDWLDHLDDPVIVPVPETSIHAAEGLSEESGIIHRQSMTKNRYIGRTFIAPGGEERSSMLSLKHNVMPEDVAGLDIILVDDSIVRSGTMKSVIKKVKDAGARTVSALVSSPPIRYSDFYGTDTPDQGELIAASRSIEEVQRTIGADYLGYLQLFRLINATGIPKDRFNLSCFNGEYPIDIGEEARQRIYEPSDLSMIDV